MANILQTNLSRYIDACFPILYLNLYEESKADEIIKSVADRRTVVEWSVTKGHTEYNAKETDRNMREDRTIEQLLQIKAADSSELERTLFVVKDAHMVFDNKNNIAALKEIALQIGKGLDCSVILMSPILIIPPELEKYITILEMDTYTDKGIRDLIDSFTQECGITVHPALLEEMAVAFKGLSEFEIRNIISLSRATSANGELTRRVLSLIFEQKQQMIKKSGILDMVPLKEKPEDIGGLEALKKWLERKAVVIKDVNKAADFGVDAPKGVLIAGVPGCGKSLSAKAAAALFDIPLLRLDLGRLMGKYVGESESNMRKAIALAEAISPCVLWIDELEKAFAGIGNEGGGAEVTTRLLGTFLTWMQEKTTSVFVVATANNIVKLPPEMLRKGRFDEIFYVGLPNNTERKMIFEIHIGKRGKHKDSLSKIDLGKLVEKTQGYSGADIEGVVR